MLVNYECRETFQGSLGEKVHIGQNSPISKDDDENDGQTSNNVEICSLAGNVAGKAGLADSVGPGEEIWTVAEVAAYLRINCNTVRAGAQSGKIRGRKILGQWRFLARDIREMMS